MTRRHRRIRSSLVRCLACCGLAIALLLACPLLRGTARAQIANCTLTGPTLTFGTIDVFSTSNTSNNATLTCTAVLGGTVYACLSIGTGSGGTTAANRTLASGSNKIPIQITGGASWPTQIGNGTSYPMEGPISLSVPLLGGAKTFTFALAVSLPAPSPLPAAGTYSSTFTSTDFQAIYSVLSLSPPSTCTGGSLTATATGTLAISATVVNQCHVAAGNMNFGTAGVLATAVPATSTISLNCNGSIPVTIALDNGATGTGPTARKMTSGVKSVTYGIYRDSAHTLPWGATVGTNTGSATGPSGSVTAFGLVPAQTTPTPGSYSDVVNVTATY